MKEGDTVSEGQPVIEIETDKAVVEVPANAGGTVTGVNVKVGDTVKVGGVIATLGGASAPLLRLQPHRHLLPRQLRPHRPVPQRREGEHQRR